MRLSVVLPALIVGVLVIMLGYSLTRDPRALPSALIGQPAPVNVWASWCVACRSEVSLLAELSQHAGVPVLGLDYKDDRVVAQRWLKRFGNPFWAIAFDATGDTGINWGVAGVPETFLVDAQGVIRYKVVGAITEQEMRAQLLPAIRRLQAGP